MMYKNVKYNNRNEALAAFKKMVQRKKETEAIFANFSNDWGEGMTTEEYSDMLRSKNVVSTRTVEDW